MGSRYHCLEKFTKENEIPDPDKILTALEQVKKVMDNENPLIRPYDRGGSPGGLVMLKDLPLIIVPDLHARVDYMKTLAGWIPPGMDMPVLSLLEEGKIQIVCAGDGFHSEGAKRERWIQSYQEYIGGFEKHRAMDDEMRESLTLMLIVMDWKTRYPDLFHFLKGNHENIMNENTADNRAFAKFAAEGEMVKVWSRRFLGDKVLSSYYDFEKFLPIMAVGSLCCVTHAEPRNYYTKDEIINCYMNREIIFDFTWTDNGESKKGTVESYLSEYFPHLPEARMYGGHRPVKDLYQLRAEGRYVQIHNPERYAAVFLNSITDFETNQGLHYLDNQNFSRE
ncbi:MAG: metallophosphoesterase [Spirochaetia bacterium]|jgi:hypothetical protein|nr:metallophosphoesterase [Spirochaetia bacterium]